jgi:glycosyltransferase involved in cell wall biosynthesis
MKHKNNPKVSVIIPTYNYAHFLPEALNSVLDQTYKNFEVIIVDDGSTDNTKDVLKSFLNDQRIRYIYQENSGLPATRNRGIKESKGQFVAFLDSDDVWLPAKLEKQILLFDNDEEIVLVYCGAEFIDVDGERIPDPGYKPIPGATYKDLLYVNWVIGSGSSVLIRKSVFGEAGFFDESLTGLDDIDMWIRILRNRKSDYVDEVQVKIRRHRSMEVANTVVIKKREKAYFHHMQKYMELFPELKEEKKNAYYQTYRKLFYKSYEVGRFKDMLPYFLKACSYRPSFFFESITSHLRKKFKRIPKSGQHFREG